VRIPCVFSKTAASRGGRGEGEDAQFLRGQGSLAQGVRRKVRPISYSYSYSYSYSGVPEISSAPEYEYEYEMGPDLGLETLLARTLLPQRV
jgi:hypothetical protein